MTPPAQPSDRLITQTAQALSICADPSEPWADLDDMRREHWRHLARLEHGVPVRGSLVTVTRGMWVSVVGRVTEVQPDASGDRFYVVALLGMPEVEPLFLHCSEVALYDKAAS